MTSRPISAVAAAAAIALPLALATPAAAQTGALDQAVGGYSFEQAAKEAPGTKDYHSKDGRLTFAIITTPPATASSTRPMSAPRSPPTRSGSTC